MYSSAIPTHQYCGNTPPIVLQVDHIHPVSKGGENNIDNLITSCQPCNIGKGVGLLNDIPKSLKNRAKEIAENELQIQQYNKILSSRADRIEKEAWVVIERLEGCEVGGYDTKRILSIKRFIGLLPINEILEAADITASKFTYIGAKQWKYFCAVCWNKIKGVDPSDKFNGAA